ncbi:MAG TPA: hypothetical protein EYP33_06310 [Pyrodictium sp.]|nr:hypothetical protein [Pyrodictium sp.]
MEIEEILESLEQCIKNTTGAIMINVSREDSSSALLSLHLPTPLRVGDMDAMIYKLRRLLREYGFLTEGAELDAPEGTVIIHFKVHKATNGISYTI